MSSITDADKALLQLMAARDTLHQQKNSLLSRASRQRETTKAQLMSGEKESALMSLKRTKEWERLSRLVDQHLLSIEKSIANTETQRDILEATRTANSALQKAVSEVSQLVEVMGEMDNTTKEFDLARTALFEGGCVEEGDGDVLQELELLMGLDVPTSTPSAVSDIPSAATPSRASQSTVTTSPLTSNDNDSAKTKVPSEERVALPV